VLIMTVVAHRLAPVAVAMACGLFAACGSDDDGNPASDPNAIDGTVTVFAAASLSVAFETIGESFELAHPDVDVVFSFAASSELVAQIVEGAPADVFASADLSNMTKLVEAGAAAGAATVFAENSAAIIVAPGNPLGIVGLTDLVDADLILVTCAPEVPCGTYADDIFENAGIVVTPDSYEENVNAVVNKVVLGEADAGVAYVTDVIAAGDEASGVKIPADINVVAEYPMVVTADAPNPTAATAFVEFVLGDEAQRTLSDFGFTAP
jgi:molybdate transport system substrate-binding protein